VFFFYINRPHLLITNHLTNHMIDVHNLVLRYSLVKHYQTRIQIPSTFKDDAKWYSKCHIRMTMTEQQ